MGWQANKEEGRKGGSDSHTSRQWAASRRTGLSLTGSPALGLCCKAALDLLLLAKWPVSWAPITRNKSKREQQLSKKRRPKCQSVVLEKQKRTHKHTPVHMHTKCTHAHTLRHMHIMHTTHTHVHVSAHTHSDVHSIALAM